MTFDLNIRPVYLNINRDQVITKDYLCAMLEAAETRNS